MMQKQTVMLAALLAALPDSIMAITMEERMDAMERKMNELQSRLEHSEAENRQLKSQLKINTLPAQNPSHSSIKAIDNKLAVLEKRIDLDKSTATETAKKSPKIEVSNKGLTLKSADDNYKLTLRGYAQADGNFFLDDSPDNAIVDKFTMRRARLSLDGSLFKHVDFRIAPDFAGSQLRLFDAFVDLHYFSAASLMAGKFRQPVSLERMQTAINVTFVERSYPAQMAPNRDIGVMMHGAIAYPGYKVQYTPQPQFREFLGYELGVFNGIRDNQPVQNADSEKDNNKELAARLFAHPFMHNGSALEGLGLGVAGTWGQPKDNTLFSLLSPGQQSVVSYNAATTSSGNAYRIYPQMYWYWKSFGMMAEYLLSSQQLHGVSGNNINILARQDNTAWHINASYVLTGENNTFFNIKPEHVFDPVTGSWGAFQVAARWSEMDIDKSTFQNYGTSANAFYLSDSSKSINRAQSWALGFNWILNENIKIMTQYEQTHFSGGAINNTNRPTENVFLSRFQFVF